MHELPATWQRWSPRILTIVGIVSGWMLVNMQGDPEWYQQFGMTAGAASLVTLLLGWVVNEFNVNKASNAPAQAPPGVDQLQHSVATTSQLARQLGNAAVADKLDALHQQMKGVPA